MENAGQQDSAGQHKPIVDAGSSLGYEQGMEYQYLNPTHPLSLPAREERLRQLRASRLRRLPGTQPANGQRDVPQQIGAPVAMSVGKAALIITSAAITGRLLGLLRTSLFTAVFKPSDITDAYNQAFQIPNLIFNVVAGGALLSAFIPVFNSYLVGKRDAKTAWHVASSALNLATVGLVVLASLAMIFADRIVQLYAINVAPAHSALIASLTRVMLLQSIIMGAGVIINAVLNARQHFLLPAIGSLLYPLGLIIGLLPGFVLVLLHQPNDSFAMYYATWGVVGGALLMVVIQLPALHRVGMHYSFSLDILHPGIRQIARQMAPRVVNALMFNLSAAVDLVLLSLLVSVVGSDGFITRYTLAFTVVTIPLSVVMSVGTAAFPTMTAYVAENRMDHLIAIVLRTLRSILFVSIPSSIGLMLLSVPVVQVLYEHGYFTLNDAQLTAIPLIAFAVGLPGLAAVEILTRSFYALRNSTTPVFVSVGQFILKIALGLLLIDPAIWCVNIGLGKLFPSTLTIPLLKGAWGMGALALATSIAALLEAVVLLWLLHQHVGGLRLRALVSFVIRVLLASLSMSLAIVVSRWILDMLLVTVGSDGTHSLTLTGIVVACIKLFAIICIGCFVYLRTARFLHMLGSEDLGPVNRLLIRLRLSWI
jgi:putative peptidoglycan lipid II flippase